jgi:hypothetical protein
VAYWGARHLYGKFGRTRFLMKEEMEKLKGCARGSCGFGNGFVPLAYLSILHVHWNNLCAVWALRLHPHLFRSCDGFLNSDLMGPLMGISYECIHPYSRVLILSTFSNSQLEMLIRISCMQENSIYWFPSFTPQVIFLNIHNCPSLCSLITVSMQLTYYRIILVE